MAFVGLVEEYKQYTDIEREKVKAFAYSSHFRIEIEIQID
jgi:hypothetical protein